MPACLEETEYWYSKFNAVLSVWLHLKISGIRRLLWFNNIKVNTEFSHTRWRWNLASCKNSSRQPYRLDFCIILAVNFMWFTPSFKSCKPIVNISSRFLANLGFERQVDNSTWSLGWKLNRTCILFELALIPDTACIRPACEKVGINENPFTSFLLTFFVIFYRF